MYAPDINQTDQPQPKPIRFTLQQQAFFKSEAGLLAQVELKHMVKNPGYNTRDTFSARQSSFVEKHMEYLSQHPKLNPRHYLANLKLKTKVRL